MRYKKGCGERRNLEPRNFSPGLERVLMSEVTRILDQIEAGDPQASEQLLPLVYDELRRLAAQRLRQERSGDTLQATALVHEAYLRLVDRQVPQQWEGRAHFFAAAAESMRRILVERARKKKRLKRGGHLSRVDLLEHDASVAAEAEQILAVDEALQRLAVEDEQAAEIVKLRYYAGLSVDEAARTLSISRATAYRNWTFARAWIRAEVLDLEPLKD